LSENWWFDFDGRLAGADIRLSIFKTKGNEIKGGYCYKKYERRIPLSGKIAGDKIELAESPAEDAPGFFSLRLFTDNRDRLEGTWTNRAKSREVRLALISAVFGTAEKRYFGFYGADNDVEGFMRRVKKSIINNDREWLADHIGYPARVVLPPNREYIIIKDRRQLLENFDQIFHRDFMNRIKQSCVCYLFNNHSGVMLDDGLVWISHARNSDGDGFDFLITTINNN
jgi:hypothetical protein